WIAQREIDILLLGTGTRLRFPPPSITRPLIEARIGLEVMDIGALCRTYNILAAEGRNVGAAVLIEPA
ncbi:MTH938/NDUFAF3 family protein, partial [Comamonas sp. SCN 65-56]|uniref:Mth938-like domain-containing protein n=1 Tax=Comamonas sp. SCN 65-56 TaxID=1660095 RepID=UPI000ADA90D5